MSNTSQRIIVGCGLALGAGLAAFGEYMGFAAVKYLAILIAVAMIVEYISCLRRASSDIIKQNKIAFLMFLALLIVLVFAANSVGDRPWIMLLLLITIAAADIGAWFFGRLIGGDKMWERMSAGKTWSGQIAGIICGTAMAILYGLLGTDAFMPQLMWIGISVSLLSQYGDITASYIKRKLKIKDFGTILPGHGGILDRFDGWIYALIIVWLAMM